MAGPRYSVAGDSTRYLVIENDTEVYKIPFKDIYYLEKVKETHSICIVYKGGYGIFRGDLSDIKRGLGAAFVYAHRHVIVNALNIRKIDKPSRYLCFDNGHKCDYTKSRLKELSQWMQY